MNATHVMYKIVKVKDDILVCQKQGRYPTTFPEMPNLNWAQVGVYKRGALSPELIQIKKEDVSGKVIIVKDLLMTCPNNVLREK